MVQKAQTADTTFSDPLVLRKQLEAEFDERVRALTSQWHAEREKLINENQELRSLGNVEQTKVAIEEAEAALAGLNAEIQKMLIDDSAELSMVIQKRAQKSDIEAYLRGLRFRVK